MYSKQEYYDFVKFQLISCNDLLYLLLKGMLILEHSLNQFINTNSSVNRPHFSVEHFSMKHKIDTAKDLIGGESDDLKATIDILYETNNLKYTLMHTLKINEQQLFSFINSCNKLSAIKELNEGSTIKEKLTNIICMLCATLYEKQLELQS